MKGFNVLMVLLDGTRQDRVQHSKEIKNIIDKGVYFPNMITAAPYTLAALHAIFSGCYPTKNGVDAYYNMFRFKKEKHKTLPDYFKDLGYHTIANIGNDSIIPEEGFDAFTIHDEYVDDLNEIHTTVIKKRPKDKPFFIFFQFDNNHTNAIKNVAQKYDDFSEDFFDNKEENVNKYNICIEQTGLYVNTLIKCLEEENLMDNTLVIFFSDHGMSNGEKIGEKMYGSFVYDYTIKVFMIILSPQLQPKKITYQTRTIDIMPTILDIFGIEENQNYDKMQGKSLIPFLKDEEHEDRVAFCETGGLKGPWPSPSTPNVKAVRYKDWKLIHNFTPDTWELYNLLDDPEENLNVYHNFPEIHQKLKEIMDKIEEENKGE